MLLSGHPLAEEPSATRVSSVFNRQRRQLPSACDEGFLFLSIFFYLFIFYSIYIYMYFLENI